jgi:hypothetical protein
MLYQRSIQAPQVPAYFIDQLRIATEDTKQQFYHHYDIESGWSECAQHTAIEKGVVHRWLDRHIGRSSLLRWLFIKVRPFQMPTSVKLRSYSWSGPDKTKWLDASILRASSSTNRKPFHQSGVLLSIAGTDPDPQLRTK